MSVTTGDTASLNDAAHRPTDAPPSPSTLSYASVMTDHASKPAAPPSDTAPAVGGINPAVVAPDGSITFNAPTDASPPSGPSQGSVDASHPTVLGLLAKGAEETLTSHYLEVAGTAVAAAGITLAIKEAALYVLGGLTTLLGGPEIGVPVFMATEALLTAGTLASAADGLWNWGQGVHDAGEALNNSTDPTKQNAAEKELQQDGSEIPFAIAAIGGAIGGGKLPLGGRSSAAMADELSKWSASIGKDTSGAPPAVSAGDAAKMSINKVPPGSNVSGYDLKIGDKTVGFAYYSEAQTPGAANKFINVNVDPAYRRYSSRLMMATFRDMAKVPGKWEANVNSTSGQMLADAAKRGRVNITSVSPSSRYNRDVNFDILPRPSLKD